LPKFRLPRKFRDLLHAANLRHGTDAFTLRAEDFLALKIRRLRPGLNPRTWVPKANTLTLDHRSSQLLYSRLGINGCLSFVVLSGSLFVCVQYDKILVFYSFRLRPYAYIKMLIET
jgi:hypothetical protein